VLLTNRLTIYLSVVGVLLAASYPFLKRYTYLPQLYLGLAFGWGIPMAFAAVQGKVPELAWLLFLGNLLWTTGYDTWYAMVDREDDLRAGAKSTAILFGDMDLVAQAVLYAGFLVTDVAARAAARARASSTWLAGRGGGLHRLAVRDRARSPARALLPRLPRQPVGGGWWCSWASPWTWPSARARPPPAQTSTPPHPGRQQDLRALAGGGAGGEHVVDQRHVRRQRRSGGQREGAQHIAPARGRAQLGLRLRAPHPPEPIREQGARAPRGTAPAPVPAPGRSRAGAGASGAAAPAAAPAAVAPDRVTTAARWRAGRRQRGRLRT
jgi:hypothetical protein